MTTIEKPITKKAQREAEIQQKKEIAYVKKVRGLLQHVAGRLTYLDMINAFDKGMSAEAYATTIAILEPVGACLHEQKIAACDRAEIDARDHILRVWDDMEKHGWDLTAAAPYPRHDDYSNRRKAAATKHHNYSGLTKNPGTAHSYTTRGPCLRVKDEEAAERHVQQRRDIAALDYDAFIVKMVGKVGECVSAAIIGDHIWSYSILTVVKTAGVTERWKTQTIINYSKYGLAYHQWPSRLMK